MNSGKPPSKASAREIKDVLNLLLGALIVLLLVLANVQLASGGGNGGSSGGGEESGALAVAPPPVQETSNHVLAEELRQLSRKLSSPLNLLREKLGPLSGLSAGQLAAASSVKDLAKSFDKVGGVQKELSQLGAGLGEVVGSTEAMAGNLGDSTETLSGVGRDIGGTREATKGMARVMRRVEATIASSGKETSESMARVGVGIEGMSEALASQRKELGASLTELNSNMTKFLKMMCVLLTSEPECS
ncbi:MAG TPA: hypothetical protein VGC63_07065 [Solirubrobacterales bacterium]|jgi:methyl-accepting chemotaxis protein